jgi:hypothetical protein
MPNRISGAVAAVARPGKLRFLPLLAATYFMVSGGPYDIEDIVAMAAMDGPSS